MNEIGLNQKGLKEAETGSSVVVKTIKPLEHLYPFSTSPSLPLTMSARTGISTISGSPSRGSLYDATTTVDDLTRSLSGFSRVATPEPPDGDEHDSEHTRAWLAVKSKLESRLVLSAGASCAHAPV
jgi:hypothetical protein